MPRVYTGKPAQFQSVEIDDFVSLVQAGGELDSTGFRERVMAHGVSLAFLRESKSLLGVAGLKSPLASYRRRVSDASGTALPESDYPYELGWLFILPSARGRKLSHRLCEPLITASQGKGIFATSRVGNAGVHISLQKLGFVQVGAEWQSKRNQDKIALFVRNAV